MIAGMISRKQVKASFGFITDRTKETEKRVNKKYRYFISELLKCSAIY
jgi:uncharacterized C2H2 Zn-finger protein